MFAYFFALGFSFFLIAFLLKFFRNTFYRLAEFSLAVVNSLLSPLEEEQKVKLVQKNTSKLVLALVKFFLAVTVSIALGLFCMYSYALLKEQDFSTLDYSSWKAIAVLSIGSTLGFLVPFKKKHKSAYNELSQLLHRMALNNYNIAYKLFKMDVARFKKQDLKPKSKFVIVTGLARAGTTSLMNRLVGFEQFASLSYANMPFVTCPNLWARIYKPKSQDLKERSHKDGIKIGLSSNEALEEYFFKMLSQDTFIKDELEEYEITQENYADYLKYQSIIKQNQEQLYLAKNNNFLLRYASARRLNKDFVMLVLFRDPLSHALSLLEKHKSFMQQQEDDAFVLEYMNWLGHHEFGKNQKPFKFTTSAINFVDDKLSLDYWLQIWINYYNHILHIEKHNVMLLDYENYCKKPTEVIRLILSKIGVEGINADLKPYENSRETQDIVYSKALMLEAHRVYKELKTL